MRTARILGEESAAANFYHVCSRAIEGRMILQEPEVKEHFRKLLAAHCEASGIHLVTWCAMDNHFHLLLEVPNADEARAKLDDEEILRRLGLITGAEERRIEMRQMLERMKEQSPDIAYPEYRQRLLSRMFDLSVFMREFKQRFTQWFNKRVDRRGPLWQDRFKSVLVEGEENLLLTMATYIDLNPVRAGIVADPKDYRWSGYGEAIAGKQESRAGLMRVYGEEGGYDGRKWRGTQALYRRYLFGIGSEEAEAGKSGGKKRASLPMASVKAVEKRGGNLAVASILKVRVRYLSDSVALGSKAWVEEVFERNREKLAVKREEGARRAKNKELAGWRGLVDLRGEGRQG
jgi:putative transposase